MKKEEVPILDLPLSSILKSKSNFEVAISKLEELNLPKHGCLEKNWDSLAALSVILNHTSKSARILDAGGELYSTILPKLSKLGYKNLIALNLAFVGVKYFIKRLFGYLKYGIVYKYGDITKTRFKDESFDVVTCLSVIEHISDIKGFFKEMSRILKEDGILFISTDFWINEIDTSKYQGENTPIQIFTPKSILEMLQTATRNNLYLARKIPFDADEKVVKWNGLEFTFIYFTLVKKSRSNNHK
jgi:SAM-dependent methyltransferase